MSKWQTYCIVEIRDQDGDVSYGTITRVYKNSIHVRPQSGYPCLIFDVQGRQIPYDDEHTKSIKEMTVAKKRKLTGGGAMTAPQHPDYKTVSLEGSNVVADNRPLNQELVDGLAKDIKEGRFKVAVQPDPGRKNAGWRETWEACKASYLIYKGRVHEPEKPLEFPEWYQLMETKYHQDEGSSPSLDLWEYIRILYASLPKIRVDIVKDYPQVDKTPAVTQNLVQWLPRDPVTGDERIRISIAGGADREYLFTERTGLIFLEYLEKMVPIRYTLVIKNDVPVNCTCKDFYNRGAPCKHIKALTAALKQRRATIEFV